MANTYTANVRRIDTSANFADPIEIVGIKYIGSSAGAVVIEGDGQDSDKRVYEASGSADAFEQVYIRDTKGVRVEITSNAVCYLYLR